MKFWTDDAEIFGALAALARSQNTYADASVRCDGVAAEQEGRAITEADEAAFEAASADDRRAMARVLTLVPHSLAGVRVLLEFSTNEDLLSHEDHARLARNLLASPALQPGMRTFDDLAATSGAEKGE